MKHRIRFFIILPMLLLLSSISCSKRPTSSLHKYSGKSAKELLIKGEAYCHHGKLEDGRNMLRYIEDNLPSSPEFPKAKLSLADSYFFSSNNSYPEAILEYTNYLKIFPNSDKKDYVLYHIALCHYASISKPERDQTKTKDAVAAFQKLLYEVPKSIYSTDAKAKISICRHHLAETELRVAIFYIKTFKYQSAIQRIKDLLVTYSDCIDYERAYFLLAEALYRSDIRTHRTNAKLTPQSNSKNSEDNLSESKIYYKKLIAEFPTSRLAKRATKRLIALK